MDEDNKELIIDIKETEDLIERDKSSSALMKTSLVFVGVALFFSIHSLISIVHYVTDDTVPLVNCPRSFDLDAPVLMKSITLENTQVQDRRIRGFVRRFITSQLPRTIYDIEPFFNFVVNHSENRVKDLYQSFLNGKEDIAGTIGAGFYIKFYPKYTLAGLASDPRLTDDSGLRIRKSETPDLYVVEQDGYLVKKMGKIQERTNITLRYEIMVKTQTLHNPEGLTVINSNLEEITDFISGTKETKEHF